MPARRLYDKGFPLVKRDFVWQCANRIAQGCTYHLYDTLVNRDFVWRCANSIAQGCTYKGFPLVKRDFVWRCAMRESYCARMYLSYFCVALFFVVFPFHEGGFVAVEAAVARIREYRAVAVGF